MAAILPYIPGFEQERPPEDDVWGRRKVKTEAYISSTTRWLEHLKKFVMWGLPKLKGAPEEMKLRQKTDEIVARCTAELQEVIGRHFDAVTTTAKLMLDECKKNITPPPEEDDFEALLRNPAIVVRGGYYGLCHMWRM